MDKRGHSNVAPFLLAKWNVMVNVRNNPKLIGRFEWGWRTLGKTGLPLATKHHPHQLLGFLLCRYGISYIAAQIHPTLVDTALLILEHSS